MNRKTNPFLPQLAALCVGLVSLALLGALHSFVSLSVFSTLSIAWIGFLFGAHVFVSKRAAWKNSMLPLTIGTAIATLCLLLVLESSAVRVGLVIGSSAAIGLLFGWAIDGGLFAGYTKKPFRRFEMMLWTIVIYAIVSFFFALISFFPGTTTFVLSSVAGAAVCGLVGFMVWRLYYPTHTHTCMLWGVILGLASIELLWVFHMLPFAYTILGFFVTWIWYLMQLLIRFHFSPRGIVWKKQAWFFSGNGLLFLLMLVFFVRWV